jgi:hypothetical protein
MPFTSLGASSAKARDPDGIESGAAKTAKAAATAAINLYRIGIAPVQAIGSAPYPVAQRSARAGNGHSRRNRDKIMQTRAYLTSSVADVLR